MPANDTAHTWELTIGGVNVTANVEPGTLQWSQGEAGRVWSLDCTVRDPGSSYDWSGWEEVVLTSDPGEAGEAVQFGGYLLRPAPVRRGPTTGKQWEVHAEGYMMRAEHAYVPAVVYAGQTPAQITAALFTAAGLSDFTTDVEAGSALASFVAAEGDKLPALMDKLCALAGGWTWGIDGEKRVWAGPTTTTTAPFAVSDNVSTIDYSSVYPMRAGSLTAKQDATEVYSRVRIFGGKTQVDATPEVFAYAAGVAQADGSLLFNLSRVGVAAFLSVKRTRSAVDTEYMNTDLWGWDWYTAAGKSVYLHRQFGTVRFVSGVLQAGDTVTVSYRYEDRVMVTRTNSTLYTAWGYHVDGPPVYDNAIITEAAAEQLGDALLDLHATAAVDGSFTVERLGLAAGQAVTITSTVYGLSGAYLIRKAGYTMLGDYQRVRCEVGFGDDLARLRDLFGNQQPSEVVSDDYGQTGVQRVAGHIEILTPGTTFTWPT